MLSILSTILSWDDSEREKAGLQKVGKGKAPMIRRKSSNQVKERSAEEEAAMNEVSPQSSTVFPSPFLLWPVTWFSRLTGTKTSANLIQSFSNLFVEFLLKESAQGQSRSSPSKNASDLPLQSPGIKSPPPFSLFSPTGSGQNTPGPYNDQRSRRMSTASNASSSGGPGQLPATGRKASYGLSEALER